ncbi:unnamed protein product [Soboliphyme baturini]|uniref:Dolichyldiphosphatase n=1 Tax=Soboliphyme baturini TaxID=241478 RepID=A0A183INL8_9BILA|nr:unnamed protein product [Soboliphyme baturini]
MVVDAPFTTKDWGMIAVATVVPCGYAFVSYMYLKDSEYMKWFQSLKKPRWMQSSSECQATCEAVLMSSVCCGTYLAYKHSEGFTTSGSKLAVAALSGFAGLQVFARVFFLYCHNLPMFAGLMAVSTAVLTTLSYAFHGIHPLAGTLVMPAAVCSFCGVCGLTQMAIEERKSSKGDEAN